MKPALSNYARKRGWKAITPLLPCCILPLALVGFTAKPALDYTGLLVERMPKRFEATEFYEVCLRAARDLDLDLETIVPHGTEDLGFPVARLTVHECDATLKGRAYAEHLTAFLTAMHREGHPVCVHACKLHALEDRPGVFEFHLELGAFFLARPDLPDTEDESDDS